MYKKEKWFWSFQTENGLGIMPMRYYHSSTEIDFDSVKTGDVLVGFADTFDGNALTLKVGDMKARLPYEKYGITGCTDKEKAIRTRIGKKVIVRVEKKCNDKTLLVERKSIAEETIHFFQGMIGQVIEVSIENVTDHSVFVELGNGIQSYIPFTEMSRAFIPAVKQEYYPGMKIKVKLLGYDAVSELFEVSRKRAYEPIVFKTGSQIVVTVREPLANSYEDAVFVEYDPNNIGIMNIPPYMKKERFSYGRKLVVEIRSQKAKGFKANFLSF